MASNYSRRNKTYRTAFNLETGERWRLLKEELKISHGELALLLLDSYNKMHLRECAEPLVEPLSSTPANVKHWRCDSASETLSAIPEELSDICPINETTLSLDITQASTDHKSTILCRDDSVPTKQTSQDKPSLDSVSSYLTSDTGDELQHDSYDPTYYPTDSEQSDDEDEMLPDADSDEELSILLEDLTSTLTKSVGDDSFSEVSDDEHEFVVKEKVNLCSTKQSSMILLNEENIDEIVSTPVALAYLSCLRDLASIEPPSCCSRCQNPLELNDRVDGTAVDLLWVCCMGHVEMRWSSQPKFRYGVPVGNVLYASAVVISGNTFAKSNLMMKCLNVTPVSRTFFYNIQKEVIVPEIDTYFTDLLAKTHEKYQGQNVVAMGDGGMDSPGHCAKFCVYTVMELNSRDILSLTIVDKRETELKSPNMEKKGFMKAMDYLDSKGVELSELVTDAHTGIAAAMRIQFPNIEHSLDMWHAAKNLLKKLTSLASEKGMSPLRSWIKDVIRHFWSCTANCGGDVDVLLDLWISVIHHIVGEHEWATGACPHAELTTSRDDYIEAGSECHIKFTRLVLDPLFLKKMDRYTKCRSSAGIESFQNVRVTYTAKRQAYQHEAFTARNQMAAIDHMHHKDRAVRKNTVDGKEMTTTRYSKAANAYIIEPVKERKDYSYLPILQRRILNRRSKQGPQSKRQSKELPKDHPKRIRLNIAPIPRPPLSEITRRPRFEKYNNN